MTARAEDGAEGGRGKALRFLFKRRASLFDAGWMLLCGGLLFDAQWQAAIVVLLIGSVISERGEAALLLARGGAK